MIYIFIFLNSILFWIYTNFYVGLGVLVCQIILVSYYQMNLYKQDIVSKQNQKISNNLHDEQLLEIDSLNAIISIFSSVDVGVVLIDNSGNILYNNDKFLEQFNLKKIENYLDIKNNDLRDVFTRSIISNEFSTTNLINNKYFDIQVRRVELVDNRDCKAMQFYDVTKLKQMNNEQRKFLVDTSHELRSPLAAIIMAKDVLKREFDNDFINIIDEETSRLKYLINDLFELAQLESNVSYEFDEINLSELCRKYKLKYGVDKRFILSVDNNLVIDGNYQLIDRMIQNLIDNAFKYSSNTGYVKLALRKFNNEVILKISDDGIGIDKNDLNKIFERFYRVDNSRTRTTGGSGLGLAIVKEIVNIHNANIDVVSEVDIGTTFIIKFKVKGA